MKNLTITELKSEINTKKVKGDYITIGKMLGVDGNNARMKYERSTAVAVVALYLIVTNREKLITNADTLISTFINEKLK